MNPWRWYTDPAVLVREQEHVFRHAWHYAGHAGQLAAAGDRVVARAGDVPLLVVRSDDGALRAFVNVCRHRGSLLAEEDGRAATIQCPYHAWTYGLDGRLLRAPRTDGLDISLVPAAVDTWGPFVFAAYEPEAPLTEWLGQLPELLAVELDALEFSHRAPYELAANWKIAAENYLECYHCPVAHKDFSAAVDVSPDAYVLEARERIASQFARARDGEPAAGRGEFHFVWPNLKLNVFPGPPNLSLGSIHADGPERTVGFLDYFFARGADEQWKRELLELDDVVGAEDRALVERVQRGVRANVIETGRLLPESEQLVAWFQARVATALSDEAARATPGARHR